MLDHQIGTREEWQAARAELARLEAEHTQLAQKVSDKRRQLPWVPVEKDYEFDTADGTKTLAELAMRSSARGRGGQRCGGQRDGLCGIALWEIERTRSSKYRSNVSSRCGDPRE